VSELPSVFLAFFLSLLCSSSSIKQFTKNEKQEMLIIIFMAPTSVGKEGRHLCIYIYEKENQSFLSSCSP
jgi:hypothetical protein